MEQISQGAMHRFRQVVGVDHVIDDHRIDDLAITTFATQVRIKGAVYPANRGEVIACINVANELKVKLYPISQGKNIGLGAQVPNSDDCVIFNLSRMNKILDFNEELGFISVEPGVTQADVAEFLKQKRSKLVLSVTGSFPESSIIGNAADRGDTLGPYIERCDYVCNLGVVLANGDYIKTGAGLYQNSKVQHLSKWGIGPDLTGLFIQSNLGVITELTLWLSPRLKDVDAILFTFNSDDEISQVSNALRELKLQDVISTASIRNDYKLASGVIRYPWKELGENKSLDEWMTKWRRKFALGKWNGIIMLRSNSCALNQAKKKLVYAALKGKVTSIFSTSDIKFKLLSFFKIFIYLFTRVNYGGITSLKSTLGMQGVPNSVSANSLYWRKPLNKDKKPDLLTPEKDKVGFIWISVLVPALGSDIVKAIHIAEKIMRQYQFEPNLCALNSVGNRVVMFPCAIIYDREIAGEDEKAMQCYHELLKQFIAEGYYPNRLGIQSMSDITKTDYDNIDVISLLKKNLDPNDIIAPGKYDFRAHW